MNIDAYYDEEEQYPVFEWMTPKEVQIALGIGANTFYRLVNSKRLPAYRIGKLWRVKRSELEKWSPKNS